MAKGKSGQPVFKRFWVQAPDSVRKKLAHLAIDLDVSAEKLAGLILTDAVSRAQQNPDVLKALLPKPKSD